MKKQTILLKPTLTLIAFLFVQLVGAQSIPSRLPLSEIFPKGTKFPKTEVPEDPEEAEKTPDRSLPNIDLIGEKNTPREGYAGDQNACVPAAFSNSLMWLVEQHNEIKDPIYSHFFGEEHTNREEKEKGLDEFDKLVIKQKQDSAAHRDLLELASGLMNRKDAKGVEMDTFIMGKLELIDSLRLPIKVKYQSLRVTADRVESPNARYGHFAENQSKEVSEQAPNSQIDPKWILDELKDGEDVEMNYHCFKLNEDSTIYIGEDGEPVTTVEHCAVIPGMYTDNEDFFGLLTLDDTAQMIENSLYKWMGYSRLMIEEGEGIDPYVKGMVRLIDFERISPDSMERCYIMQVVSESYDINKTFAVITSPDGSLPPDDPSKPGLDHQLDYISTLAKPITYLAKGTGLNTGAIGVLTVSNHGNKSIATQPQTFYIPSENDCQGYVARIPEGTVVPPGESVGIPIIGYCIDESKPPVPKGQPMIPDNWIPVEEILPIPESTESPDTDTVYVNLLPDPVPPFQPEDIPDYVSSPNFSPAIDNDTPYITVTWPGTGIPVNGTIDPGKDPRTSAPVIVEYVVRIEEATTVVLQNPDFTTPYSSKPKRERETVCQQTIWSVMGPLTGKPRKKGDLKKAVYKVFGSTSGRSVESLSIKEKKKLDIGVDDLNRAILATGVKAKVIETPSDTPDGDVLIVKKNPKCKSDGITYDFSVTKKFGGLSLEVYEEQQISSISKQIPVHIDTSENGTEFTVNFSNIKAHCSCYCNEEFKKCKFYPNIAGTSEADTTKQGKLRIRITNKKNIEKVNKDDWAAADAFKLVISVKDGEKDFEMKIKITGYCQLNDCDRQRLNEEIKFKFKLKKEKNDKKR